MRFNDSTGYKRHDNIFSRPSQSNTELWKKGCTTSHLPSAWSGFAIWPWSWVDLTEANFTLMDYSLTVLFNNTLCTKSLFWIIIRILSNQSGNVEYLVSASTSFAHESARLFLGSLFNIWKCKFPISVDGGVTYLVHPRVRLIFMEATRDVDETDTGFVAGYGFRLDQKTSKPESFKKPGYGTKPVIFLKPEQS